jgi:hypothetical protein
VRRDVLEERLAVREVSRGLAVEVPHVGLRLDDDAGDVVGLRLGERRVMLPSLVRNLTRATLRRGVVTSWLRAGDYAEA